MTFAVELQGVEVTYPSRDGAVRALAGVDLALRTGTSTAVVGRSGSGKSTLVSILTMLRRPTSGRVLLQGEDVGTLDDARLAQVRAHRVGIVFQSFHLEPALTAVENVMLAWFFAGGPGGSGGSGGPGRARQTRAAARERAGSLLERLGIGDLAGRRPTQMSGGQRQRVAIARALFTEPALLVADEPTGNLDEETANGVADLLLGLPVALGTTVVLVTHDSAIAARAQRQVDLVQGRVAAEVHR